MNSRFIKTNKAISTDGATHKIRFKLNANRKAFSLSHPNEKWLKNAHDLVKLYATNYKKVKVFEPEDISLSKCWNEIIFWEEMTPWRIAKQKYGLIKKLNRIAKELELSKAEHIKGTFRKDMEDIISITEDKDIKDKFIAMNKRSNPHLVMLENGEPYYRGTLNMIYENHPKGMMIDHPVFSKVMEKLLLVKTYEIKGCEIDTEILGGGYHATINLGNDTISGGDLILMLMARDYIMLHKNDKEQMNFPELTLDELKDIINCGNRHRGSKIRKKVKELTQSN